MTRNDFELIAKTLKSTKPNDRLDLAGKLQLTKWEIDVKAIAQMLSNQNARFNFNTFYEACGLDLVK